MLVGCLHNRVHFCPQMKTQTREHHQMQAVNSATALLAPRTEREYPVLFRSPNVNKCQDAGWIIPFAALLAFAAFYGIRGAQLVTNPRAFCSIVSGSQLDSGGLLSPPSHVAGADLYGNCIHFVVVGDLATARSSCLVFAVNSLVASNASISIPSVKSWSPSLLSSDLVSSLHSSASHSLSHTVTHSLASHAHSHKRDGIPSMPSVSIPPQIQSAFTMCTLFVSLKSPNAPSMCVQYGVLAFFGAAGANSTQFQSLIQSCVAPILDGTISPFTTTSTKVNSCVDSGISMLPGNNSSSLSPNTAIFTHCMESISNKADVQQMEACVRNALPTVANATLSAFLAGCVDPVVKGGTQGLVGCISAGFQAGEWTTIRTTLDAEVGEGKCIERLCLNVREYLYVHCQGCGCALCHVSAKWAIVTL
ncbi:hypothetical protein BC830DRAFT_694505 [Chytriomyces sp. MP71]|nr:hypothetical protein BC830DRAFT_694505 [Chytriomyces sp. MP71]